MRKRTGVDIRIVATAALLTCVSGRLVAQHESASHATHRGDSHPPFASGTSWLPDSSPVQHVELNSGEWRLMTSANINGVYGHQLTQRGDQQLGLIDWEMLMATRVVGAGQLDLRAMTSIEPFVLGGGGYPELLQTGGSYRNAFIHDRQHPHDFVVELAGLYDTPIAFVYAAAVGEPALGPVAFMHRPSAQNDPFAPLGHHWQDAAHQSYGVVTLGVHSHSLQLEGSAFNPREADEGHLIADYRGARLDSYSGRLSWSATPYLVASTWWGYLTSHDRLDPDTRMHRYGASLIYGSREWSSTLVWGMNLHHHSGTSHLLLHGGPDASPHHHASSLLAEVNVNVADGRAVFARAERVMKDGEELGFLGGDLTELYDIRSVSAGMTQRLASIHAFELALGARGVLNFVPETLLATYGTRTPSGFAFYLQLR